MTKMKCYVQNGVVIHIGDWPHDYYEENGVQIDLNPIPAGVIETEREIVIGYDGGMYEEGKEPANEMQTVQKQLKAAQKAVVEMGVLLASAQKDNQTLKADNKVMKAAILDMSIKIAGVIT